jgi:uncharacterized protein YdhG (YjbR/CyaY superfamily)
MAARRGEPRDIDQYIGTCAPEVRAILEKLRTTIRRAAPRAREMISYRIPAFALHGILIYFAAFKRHIGIYPPIKGNARLEAAVAKYAGPKGNLRFPLDRPIPYALVARIVKFRAEQSKTKARAKKRKSPAPTAKA